MSIRQYVHLLTAMTIAMPGLAAAEDQSPSMFAMRGFGTVGIVHTSEDRADFVGNFFQRDGAGYTHATTLHPDTKLGVQLDARFNERWSAVVQAVAQYNYEGKYAPELEWANVAYRFSPDFEVRAGRFVAPTFMYSESRLVGYAQPWVRPPHEIYALLPTTNKDGIDLTYRHTIGETQHNFHVSYSASTKKLPGGGETSVDRYLDLHDIVTYGVNTFHAGLTSIAPKYQTPSIDALFAGFRQFGLAVPGPAGQQALSIAHQRDMRRTIYTVMTLGATHDPGDWLFSAEWADARPRNPRFFSDFSSWYVLAAYQHGNFTPYVIVADVKASKPAAMAIDTTGLPAPLPAMAGQLNAGLAALVNGFALSQNSMSAGVRWDFAANADLKLQLDRVRPDAGSTGWLVNAQPGFQSGRYMDIYSLAVDFVF